ncbi:hypothetical protein LD119_00702 [Mesoplasma sp. JKS002660]|uniref:lipoprotein n=1 Tax=Mesoplasma whartonense TaxID=2878854 RepID=UPI002022B652|nr:lipoprotein [Mesoplasma sp. JKS002660]MCL8213751.1 hypothetical protein [Mesoplasma sp. JKS002660]
MKKLLLILGSIGITATAATTVTACSNPPKVSVPDGDWSKGDLDSLLKFLTQILKWNANYDSDQVLAAVALILHIDIQELIKQLNQIDEEKEKKIMEFNPEFELKTTIEQRKKLNDAKVRAEFNEICKKHGIDPKDRIVVMMNNFVKFARGEYNIHVKDKQQEEFEKGEQINE